MRQSSYNGKDFGVPLNVNIDSGPFLIYDVDDYKAAGVTPNWSAGTASSRPAEGHRHGWRDDEAFRCRDVRGPTPVTQCFLYYLRAGGTFYSADKKSVDIANPAGEIALQTMYDLIHKDKVDDTSLTDYEGIASGTAASVIWGPWYTALAP